MSVVNSETTSSTNAKGECEHDTNKANLERPPDPLTEFHFAGIQVERFRDVNSAEKPADDAID